MADAVVLTPDQIKQLLAQQQQQQNGAGPSTSSAAISQAAAAPAAPATPAKHRIKTSFKKERAFEPFYTGGPIALTPDGQWLAATHDEEVVILDVNTGAVLHRIESDTEPVTALTISPSGSHLIVASRSLAIRTYSLPTFDLVRSTPKAHTAQVNVILVDPTSTLVATGSSDGIVKVWDIAGGYCTHVFRGHGGVVSGLCWNLPDPALEVDAQSAANAKSKAKANIATPAQRRIELFTGSVDGKIRLWDLAARTEATHRPVATLNGHASVVRGLAVTDDGTTLVSGSRDNSIIVWSLVDGRWRQRDTLAANEGVESAGFLARGASLSRPQGSPKGKQRQQPRQTLFFTGGSNGQVKLWDVVAGSIVCREPRSLTQQMALDEVAAGVRSRRTAGGDGGGDDDDAEETRAITAVHYLPATASLVSVHADQNIVVRSVASLSPALSTADGAAAALPPLTKTRQMVGFNDEIVDVALLSARGEASETHVALATNSRSIRVYTIDSEDHDVSLLYGHSDVVLCLDRSPDARWVASGAKDRTARIWAWVPQSRLPRAQGDAATAGEVAGESVERGQKTKKAKAASSDAKGDTGDADGDSTGGEWVCVAVCEGHAESVGAIAFARRAVSPGAIGAPFMITASQDRTAKLWDLSALSELLAPSSAAPITAPLRLKSLLTLKIHDKDINSLDIAPNNALLASGSQDRTAKIFAISYAPPSKSNGFTASASLKPLSTLKGHKRGVWSVRFSPVDLALATGSGDKTIRLWGLKDYTCVKIFEGHTNSVLKLQFCSAGMQLLSCAGDGLVKLWGVKEEDCVDTLDGHDEKVWSIAATRDESRIVSVGADSVVNFWLDTTEINESEKRRQREEEVLREQDFSNYLTLRDFRNAIALALEMGQPRRLLGLFTHVAASRPDGGDGATAGGLLLDSALQCGTAGNLAADPGSGNLDALARGGVLSLPSVGARGKKGSKNKGGVASELSPEAQRDAASVTGLAAVDEVLSSLTPSQLIQLLAFVRDWNTSTRTAGVAQTVLHAVLRFHGASSLIEAFDASSQARRDEAAQRLEDVELGVVDPHSKRERERQRREAALRKSGKGAIDLAGLIDGLLPYTERHYNRADRMAIEASMLEFTLGSMDAILGPIDDDEEEEVERGDVDERGEVEDVEMAPDETVAAAFDDDDDGEAAGGDDTFGQKLKTQSKKKDKRRKKEQQQQSKGKKGAVQQRRYEDVSASEDDD
ncbi:uncharacterized protein PFL1_03198 [Pseudozyma flocculosa PF-1]|uniref:Related to UTP13 - U3 snoRNP protein n=2 Tax=Pseudozyma flocculosa TaxID=84751 RepID=A0A5C3F1M9_9BASI|nr:uncharacterized protein PFL1_03198 [Pseudozyma flocculosa PF-1]EPQ29443.1 hypothetical protein PFL1_03198 [Pseudozyma flocculosa PF-1]SPO37970.1 related to UTP13 - U3 snoRNP protein [Pseudozyma flocculosa]